MKKKSDTPKDVSLFVWPVEEPKRSACCLSDAGQKPQNINHHALSITASAAANHANAISRRGHAA